MSLRTRKRQFIILSIIAILAWILTLGVHSMKIVSAYSQGHEQYDQPEVYVFMESGYYSTGIPFLYTHSSDALPYTLDVAVTVDDKFGGDGVVIDSFVVLFRDGSSAELVRKESPRGGPFGELKSYPAKQVEGTKFRRARIAIPEAIHQRGSFSMNIKGHVYGETNKPFERVLQMDYNRELKFVSGWLLYVIGPSI